MPTFELDYVLEQLPIGLRNRVIGTTWDNQACWPEVYWLRAMGRHRQIKEYIDRHDVTDWLAIDDNDQGWPDDQRDRLVFCEDDYLGISHPETRRRLDEALQLLAVPATQG